MVRVEAQSAHTSAETAERALPPRCTISTTSAAICAGSQSPPWPASPWCWRCGRQSRSDCSLPSLPRRSAAISMRGRLCCRARRDTRGKRGYDGSGAPTRQSPVCAGSAAVEPAVSFDQASSGGSTNANVKRPSAAVSPSTVALALARPIPRRRRSISTSRRN